MTRVHDSPPVAGGVPPGGCPERVHSWPGRGRTPCGITHRTAREKSHRNLGPGPANTARCSRSPGMIAAGMPTVRRAARDFTGPSAILLPGARRSENATRTRTRPASRSISARVSAVASPPANAGERRAPGPRRIDHRSAVPRRSRPLRRPGPSCTRSRTSGPLVTRGQCRSTTRALPHATEMAQPAAED